MPQSMAKHSLKVKYTAMQKINYGEEDEIINKPLLCTALGCNEFQTDKGGMIKLERSKRDTGIQYRQTKKDETKGFIPKLVAHLK